MTKYTPQESQLEFQFAKLCECGCGQPAPIAKHSNTKLGHTKGQPLRFAHGHQSRVRPLRSLTDRFWEKVDRRGPDDCWEWTASRDKPGYGRLGTGRRSNKGNVETMAHRISYQIHHGPIPDNLLVLHKCDNPPCVNPKHLFLGTQLENVQDMIAKGRQKTSNGDTDPHAKLDKSKVVIIREMVQRRVPYIQIAQDFHISVSLIEKIVSRRVWKHI